MKKIFQLLLSLSQILLFFAVFLIKDEVVLFQYKWLSYIVYLLMPLALSWICLCLVNHLPLDQIESKIISIDLVNSSFLPSYLGYFFVALSVPRLETAIIIFVLLFIFTFFSASPYFNPIFLVLGYNFYQVETSRNTKILIISKSQIRRPEDAQFHHLYKVNNFTFIEKDREQK
jgi:hypothetical protein